MVLTEVVCQLGQFNKDLQNNNVQGYMATSKKKINVVTGKLHALQFEIHFVSGNYNKIFMRKL